MRKSKLGNYANPYRANEDGSLNVEASKPGTVWVRLPGGGLLSIDCYGDVPEIVLYGDEPISIRTSGEPLDSGTIYTPKRSA